MYGYDYEEEKIFIRFRDKDSNKCKVGRAFFTLKEYKIFLTEEYKYCKSFLKKEKLNCFFLLEPMMDYYDIIKMKLYLGTLKHDLYKQFRELNCDK